ncbi:hypothetical protein [Streptomyces tubercidicus]
MLYDPHGLIEAELPLDRTLYEALVTAVLAWKELGLMGEEAHLRCTDTVSQKRSSGLGVRGLPSGA